MCFVSDNAVGKKTRAKYEVMRMLRKMSHWLKLKPGQNVEMIIYFLTLVPVYKDESEDKLKLRFLKSYRLGETKQF